MNNIEKSALFKTKIQGIKFFKHNLPEIDELVRIKILDIQDVGIECLIPEYNSKCFLAFQEASNSRKLYRIKRQYKINKIYIAKVSNVDSYKGYIDVSTRNVFDDEIKKFETNINLYEKLINAIIKSYIYQKGNDNVDQLLHKSIYKLNLNSMEKYLKRFHDNDNYFFDRFDNIDEYLDKDILLDEIKNYLPMPEYDIVSKIRVNSTSINGSYDIIDAINKINNKLGTNYKFLKTPYFQHSKKHIINKNKDSDIKHFKESLDKCIKNIDIDYLYIISEDVSIIDK